MIHFITTVLHDTWSLTAEMAPYLLFGFLVAGLLHALLKKDFIKNLLGRPGIGAVVKASILGVPMPLCSCSVIPVAATLRKSGASRGATASFLSSTPQTGVDSIMATFALLGGVFTLVRVGVAFICGIVTGYLIELFSRERPKPAVLDMATLSFSPVSPEKPEPAHSCCAGEKPQSENKWAKGTRYALITLPSDLAGALIVGLILAGMITTLLPADLLHGSLATGPLAFLFATLISLPLYVCATASIPMAYALIAAGLSPGAALVFLITGPATNTATVVAVWKMLGRTSTVIYLLSLLVIAWGAGALLNQTLGGELAKMPLHHGEHIHPALWKQVSAVAFVALLIFNIARKFKKQQKACCAA